MAGHVKVDGAWKSVAGVNAKVDGAWKSVASGHTKADGAWKQFYSAAAPGDYDLLETTILGSAASSVTFSSLATYASDYKHLQLRLVARTDRNQASDSSLMRFNGDSGSNYSWHSLLVADTSAVLSEGFASQTLMRSGRLSGSPTTANVFAASVIDILDPYSTTKNTTIRVSDGFMAATSNWVGLGSGAWYNTSALTSITLDQVFGTNFVAGSRFSLYGIKG